jgi:hypothetical protein
MRGGAAGADPERRRYMKEVPNDRTSSRRAALTGTALVAGALALSAAGCCNDKLKKAEETIDSLKVETAKLRGWEAGLKFDENGKVSLICKGDSLNDKLCERWLSQASLGIDTSRVAIPVTFGRCGWPADGTPGEVGPEGHWIDALCAC